MGCVIQDYGFTKNGGLIGSASCSIYTTDKAGIEADVNFDSNSVGQNVYMWADVRKPDGTTMEIWGNNGNSYHITAAGTYTFAQDDIFLGLSLLGNYQILSIYILGADKVSFVCSSTSSAYGCTSLIYTSPPVNQWNVNIYVKDSVSNSPISGASAIVASQTKTTDTNGYVTFRVNEGTVNISISKAGYNTFTTSELVFSDKTFTYPIVSSLPTTGNIYFVSTPAGAEIFINSVDQLAMTPRTVNNVPTGNHTFALKLSGYNDFTGNITVIGGSTVNVNAVMTPKTTGIGSLYVSSNPTGADIIIDGSPQNIKTPATITNLTVGTHAIKLSKTGYQDYNGSFTIADSTTTDISETLIALVGTGILNITSNPTGAKIFIDGTDTQKVTPATITNLASGDHTFKITLQGYTDETGIFTIVSGNTTQAAVTLTQAGISPDVMIGGVVIVIGLAGLYLALKEHKERMRQP